MKLRWALVPLAPVLAIVSLKLAYTYNPMAPLLYLPTALLAIRSAYRFARRKPIDARYLWLALAFGLHPVFGLLLLLHHLPLRKRANGWVCVEGLVLCRVKLAFRLIGRPSEDFEVLMVDGMAYAVVEASWFTTSGAYRRALRKASLLARSALRKGLVPVPVNADEIPRKADRPGPKGLPQPSDVPIVFLIGSELRKATTPISNMLFSGFSEVVADGRPWALPTWQARALIEVGLCMGDLEEFSEQRPSSPLSYEIELGPASPLDLKDALGCKPLYDTSKPAGVAVKGLNRTFLLA